MLKQINILFIDDEKLNQELNKALISFHKENLCKDFSLNCINSSYAKNLPETQEFLSNAGESDFPHIILSDIQLVGNTGFDFLKLFEDKFLGGNPKAVIALITAYVSDEDEAKVKEYSFAKGIYNRPLDYEILKDLIQKVIDNYS